MTLKECWFLTTLSYFWRVLSYYIMETYKDIQFELSKKQYDQELERKAHFTTWIGLYLTINSVLFGLVYKGICTDWLPMYLRIDVCLYWLATVAASIFAVIAAVYFLKAFKFLEYQYLKPAQEYSKWMEQYIKKSKMDRAREVTFLRDEQIKALSKKQGEAILWNRKLNDARMAKLDKSKNWAVRGYVCVLIQHFLILVINGIGVS